MKLQPETELLLMYRKLFTEKNFVSFNVEREQVMLKEV